MENKKFDKKKFDSNKYKRNWAKENVKQFKVDLRKDEFEKLNLLLNKNNLTKAQFLRNAIKELEKN